MANRQQRRNPTKQQLASNLERMAIQTANQAYSLEQRLRAAEQGLDTLTDMLLGTPKETASKGDKVIIGFLGKLNGVAFQGGSSESYVIESLGAGTMISGFEDQVVGMQVGTRKEFDLTFPENYGNKELAGNNVTFVVVLLAASSQNETLLSIRSEIAAANAPATEVTANA